VIEARTNASFEANLIGAPTGLIGALGLAIADPSTQTTVSPRDTAGRPAARSTGRRPSRRRRRRRRSPTTSSTG
jgi:hypothetical protein